VASFASLDQDQRQEVIDFLANRQSDLLEALSDSTFIGPARDVAQQDYDDVTDTLDNLFYPDDVAIMNAYLNE